MGTARIGVPGLHPSAANLEGLVSRHGNRVYQLAYRLTRSTADAEDVLQEVFFKLYRHWVQARACGNLDAWITRIATNVSIDLLRARKCRARNVGEETLSLLSGPGKRPATAAEDREVGEKLTEALEQLPPRQMAALVLFDHEGLKGKEIARILGVSETVVRSYVFQARRKVKEILTPYFRGGDR